jgi:hypothetical protein
MTVHRCLGPGFKHPIYQRDDGPSAWIHHELQLAIPEGRFEESDPLNRCVVHDQRLAVTA